MFDHRILSLFACEIIDMLNVCIVYNAQHTLVFLYQYHGNSLLYIKTLNGFNIAENKKVQFKNFVGS